MEINANRPSAFAFAKAEPAARADQDTKGANERTDRPGFRDILSNSSKEQWAWGIGNVPGNKAHLLRLYHRLESGLGIELDAKPYALTVHIGESAVAFEARPIVGPAGFEAAHEVPVAITSKSSQKLDTALPTEIAIAAQEQDRSRVESAVSNPADIGSTRLALQQAGRVSADHALQRHAPAPPASMPNVTRSVQVSATKQSAPLPQGLPKTSFPNQSTARAAAAPALGTPAQARAQVFAILIAAASEYRITVRSMGTETLDRERLVEGIRSALRSHGLPDLPINLQTTGRMA